MHDTPSTNDTLYLRQDMKELERKINEIQTLVGRLEDRSKKINELETEIRRIKDHIYKY